LKVIPGIRILDSAPGTGVLVVATLMRVSPGLGSATRLATYLMITGPATLVYGTPHAGLFT
jgi:hypothetical protein